MAIWREILTREALSDLTDVGTIADGDHFLGFDSSDGNALKKMSMPPEYFSMSFGWRANISDSSGGRYIYYPYETWGYNFFGRYDGSDISTNGTVPSSIEVKNTVDVSSIGGHQPNHTMGYIVPATCKAFIGSGCSIIRDDNNGNSLAGWNDLSLMFYKGTISNNATTTYDLMKTITFGHDGTDGDLQASGTVLMNGLAGIDISMNENIIPCIMSNASSGTGTRAVYGNFNLLFILYYGI